MAFVKLDCGMIDSTLWVDREGREVFITALLMAVPWETEHPVRQIAVGRIEYTGFEAPSGRYGFVPAAGPGIVRRSMVPHETGMEALRRLGEPDEGSRSRDFEGRRMIRVDGGYVILNYASYRDRDHTAAARQKRYRDNKRNAVTLGSNAVTPCNITQAEAEVEAEEEKSTSTRARENQPSAPTAAGQACLLMRQAGCLQTNPSNPDLLAALAEGVSPQALADTVREAIESKRQKPFSWSIQVARSRHAQGPSPTPTRGATNGAAPPPKPRQPTKIEKRTGKMIDLGEKLNEVLGFAPVKPAS